MLNDFNCSCPVYIACGYTDLRRGIDGAGQSGKDAVPVLYKRLESGSFQWPRSTKEVQVLTPQQYRWLMEGLKTEQPKANKAVSGLSVI